MLKHLGHSGPLGSGSLATEVLCLLDTVGKKEEAGDITLPLRNFLSDTRSGLVVWGADGGVHSFLFL